MNWIDGVGFLLIGAAGLYGLARGFIRELLSILSWGAAVCLAGFFEHLVTPSLHSVMTSTPATNIIGWVITFVGLLIIFSILSGLVSRFFLSPVLGGIINHILGAGLGVLKGFLIACILYILAANTVTPETWALFMKNSKLTPYLQQGSSLLHGPMSQALKYIPSFSSDSRQTGIAL